MKTIYKICLSVLMIMQGLLIILGICKMSAESIGWMMTIFLNGYFLYINIITWNENIKDVKQ